MQPPTSPPTTPPTGFTVSGAPCFDPPCIPIDGGIVFLLIAAVMLAYKVLKK